MKLIQYHAYSFKSWENHWLSVKCFTGDHFTPLFFRKEPKVLCGQYIYLIFGKEFSCEKASNGVPNGIRTRVAALKGQCPRPLDDGD